MMTFDAASSLLWTLRRERQISSCELVFVPRGAEVRIFRDGSLLMSRIFPTNAEALAWAAEERHDLIGRGWAEASAIEPSFTAPPAAKSSDMLIVSIGHDTEIVRECCLCARSFMSDDVQCVAETRFSDADEELALGYVCDDCIGAGADGVRERLEHNARVASDEDADKEHAALVKRLRDAVIIMPTAEEVHNQRAESRRIRPRKIN